MDEHPEWLPDSWRAMLDAGTFPAPAPTLQPGLGIPTETVDAIAAIPSGQDEVVQVVEDAPTDTLRPSQAELELGAGEPLPMPEAWTRAAPPPPDPFAPDAISGAGEAVIPVESITGAPTFDAMQPIPAPEDPMGRARAADVLGDAPAGTLGETAEEAAQRFAGMTDEQLLAQKLESDMAARNEALRRREEESLRSLNEQKDNYRAREEADAATQKQMDALFVEADQLSKQKQDPKRWWNNQSTGEKILAVVSAFLGGLAAPYMGGRNVGLEQIRKNIDDDIAAQLADMQNARAGIEMRRGALAQQFAKHGDALRAAEEVRAASWGHVIRQLETEQANYDPRGTIATQIEVQKRQARAAQAAAVQKYLTEEQKRQEERAFKLMEADRKERELKEKTRASKADEGIRWQKNKIDERQGDRKLAIDEAKAGPEVEKLLAEAQNLRDQGKVREAEQLQKFGVPGVTVTGEDGKPKTFVATAGTPEELSKVRSKIAATREVVALLDDIKTIRSGWTSDIGNSEENQRLKVVQGKLRLAIKNAEQMGALTGSDLDLADAVSGFKDPTQRASFGAAVDQARKGAIRSGGFVLKGVGHPGGFDLPDLTSDLAKLDPHDPAVLAKYADDFEKIARDEANPEPVRDAAAKWLQMYADGEFAAPNGKSLADEKKDDIYEPSSGGSFDPKDPYRPGDGEYKAGGFKKAPPMPQGGGRDAALREETPDPEVR